MAKNKYLPKQPNPLRLERDKQLIETFELELKDIKEGDLSARINIATARAAKKHLIKPKTAASIINGYGRYGN